MNSITFKVADSPELLDQIFRLRYEIYVEECKFIHKDTCPEGKETDKFDPYSIHFAALDQNENLVGALRLVVDSPFGFPLEEKADYSLPLEKHNFFRNNIAEISRLVISKKYRCGLWSKNRKTFVRKHFRDGLKEFKSKISPILFGLYDVGYRVCKERDITYWIAAMEHSLLRLVKENGFIFYSLGEPIEYYGKVLPCISLLEEIEGNLQIVSSKQFTSPENRLSSFEVETAA